MLECPLVKNFALIDEELLKKDVTYALLHVYFQPQVNMTAVIEYLTARFDAEGIPMSVMSTTVKEDDYANSWKQYYKPLSIGNIAVVPEWEEYEKKENETVLRIDPGMAFGTGTHETTSLCIEEIQKYAVEGKKVLDIGCGSGILSIASLLLGAEDVNAIDIDPNAVKVSYENASLNTYAGDFKAVAGNILAMDEAAKDLVNGKKYNYILANIVADVIIRLSAFVGDLLTNDGVFIMSGIITERRDEVMKALADNGFTVTGEQEKGGWLCISATR
jgi:ribosomal protein L11 methyltransferase